MTLRPALDALAPVLGSAPVGVGLWDAELRFVWLNDTLAEINGVPVAEHLGRTIGEVLPAIPPETIAVYQGVLESGRPVSDVVVSGQTPAQPGRERFWSVSVFPTDDVDGAHGLASIVTEITDLHQARLAADALEGALALETTVLEEVIARVPLGVTLLWGRELRYRMMNAEGRRMLPDRGELVGRTPSEVYPETAETFAATVLPLFDSGDQLTVKAYALPFDDDRGALDGERFYDVTFSPIRVDGPVEGVLVTYLDVTEALRERRELERQLAEERKIADTLQRALLPRRLPAVPHVEIAARYQPAGQRYEVGGDFYDVFPGRDGAWLAVVGDVCGKGPRAAARTSMVRYALRAEAAHADRPAALLRLLNRDVRRELEAEDDDDFVTLVLLSMRPSERGAELVVATAGHPEAIVTQPDGGWRLLGAPGLPVGVLDESAYVEQHERLLPGERLVLYTDGVLDAHAPEQALTTAMLARTAAPGGSVEQVADRLLAHVDAGERPARDDCALLVLGLRGA